MLETPIDDLALMFEEIVRRNRATVKIAWKTLNVMLNALKTWLHVHRVIKNRRAFPEIKFPKTRLKTDPLTVKTLETKKHMRKMFSMANGEEDIILGFYGLMGLRPSLIPVLRVKYIIDQDLDKEALKRGKLRFRSKPPIVLVPKWICSKADICTKDIKFCDKCQEETRRKVTGNKADMIFPSFIPSVIAEKIEEVLNSQRPVTLTTKLNIADNKREVTYIAKKNFKRVGFTGKPYQLRKYGNRMILKRLETLKNNFNLKELLMGHRPSDISFIYDISGLNGETVKEWREQYIEACDTWISENIFGTATKSQIDQAKILSDMAISLGVNPEHMQFAMKNLEEGRMTFEAFRNRIRSMIEKQYEEKLRGMVNQAVSEALPKALECMNNNQAQKHQVISP